MNDLTPPAIGSILLASTNPERLRTWYERAFGVTADTDGFLRFGQVGLLIDRRDDVAATPAEPARVIINLHVGDAQATARHLDAIGATWHATLEYRQQAGAWFGTVLDPDGNYAQIIELTDTYWAARHERARKAGSEPLAGTTVSARRHWPYGKCWRPYQQPQQAGRTGPLSATTVSARLPAEDLERARDFYADKLGLQAAETRPGGLRYTCRSSGFSIFQSTGRPSGEHTQMAWQADDLDAVVAKLRQRGVIFEEVNIRGLRTRDSIAEVTGNYPSAGGTGERAAWFRDSEGNLLGIGQAISRNRPTKS